MIIKSATIENFRGFHNQSLELGGSVTAIAGQNGTQKTTLLGIIATPFSMRNENHPLHGERTLEGKTFESPFNEKFKSSPKHDVVGDHKFTLFVEKGVHTKDSFTCASISRTTDSIRFWSTEGGRKEGSGFMQVPVIFLSLKRLTPIGEEKFKNDRDEEEFEDLLDDEERKLYQKWHNDILSIQDRFLKVEHLESKSKLKNTIAPETDYYGSKTISAGQDNIGKIIMAILSFRRLSVKHPNDYIGGLLLIDELDSTLFPSSQEKLIDVLFHVSKKYKIQVVFTTHSLNVLESMFQPRHLNGGKIVYLVKRGTRIIVEDGCDYETILHDLKITVKPRKKTPTKTKVWVFTEDIEARMFAKYLLREYRGYIDWMKVSMGCDSYLELLKKRFPGMLDSVIILDADKASSSGRHRNLLYLPGKKLPPDQMLYDFLTSLDDEDPFWDTDIRGYTRQKCIKNLGEKPTKREHGDKKVREIYKKWFLEQKKNWENAWGKTGDTAGDKVFTYWEEFNKENSESANEFRKRFREIYFKLTRKEIPPKKKISK